MNNPKCTACNSELTRLGNDFYCQKCKATNYHLLEMHDEIKAGDLAFTWSDPDCTNLDWVTIEMWYDDILSEVYDPTKIVPIIRKVS